MEERYLQRSLHDLNRYMRYLVCSLHTGVSRSTRYLLRELHTLLKKVCECSITLCSLHACKQQRELPIFSLHETFGHDIFAGGYDLSHDSNMI